MSNQTAVVQANFKIGDDLFNIYANSAADLVGHLADMAAFGPEIHKFVYAIKSGQAPVEGNTAPGYSQPPAQHIQQAQPQVAYSNPQGGAPTWVSQGPTQPAVQVHNGSVPLDHEGNPLPTWVKTCQHTGQYGPMKRISKETNGKAWTAFGCPAPKNQGCTTGLQFDPK
ncbi:hypothetical protein [Longispora urticae]